MNIPKVVVSWNSWFTAPLTFAGAISERYSGTVFKFSYKQNSGNKHRPIMSMARFCAKAFRIAPRKKLTAPTRILALLPLFLVTWDATNVESRAAKYRDDVKSVRSWLSYLQ
ncbi:hypothetical protein HanXRQr2_Chr16g0739381 [Helianthus annuus]|uniref:Uncharacterized protein n=1 Tax=Helianthus annuus TaxID=4232 RepID=A0A9K3GX69_HELAN|nr:hypothetical protein HanXRQr2_Chr16g0739381 [Helianthus annuus]